ncbi:MAG: hypothetical protein K2W92_07565 [Alphaproteobacteria bacterium]|nr:hypothetical protein [Alphaproteobacteria bacterium]
MSYFYRSIALISLGLLCSTESSYASGLSEKDDLMNMKEDRRVSIPIQALSIQDKDKEREKLRREFARRIQNLPNESIQPNEPLSISVASWQREDKFWYNSKGQRILLESK